MDQPKPTSVFTGARHNKPIVGELEWWDLANRYFDQIMACCETVVEANGQKTLQQWHYPWPIGGKDDRQEITLRTQLKRDFQEHKTNWVYYCHTILGFLHHQRGEDYAELIAGEEMLVLNILANAHGFADPEHKECTQQVIGSGGFDSDDDEIEDEDDLRSIFERLKGQVIEVPDGVDPVAHVLETLRNLTGITPTSVLGHKGDQTTKLDPVTGKPLEKGDALPSNTEIGGTDHGDQ